MQIQLRRFHFAKTFTLGILSIDDEDICFTLEDCYTGEGIKIPGKSCIPRVNSRVILRTEGGFHERYLKRFGPDFHKGMLYIPDIPTFEWILFHIGNTSKDTKGCILVGIGSNIHGNVSDSGGAYKVFYPMVRDALLNGEEVKLDIVHV